MHLHKENNIKLEMKSCSEPNREILLVSSEKLFKKIHFEEPHNTNSWSLQHVRFVYLTEHNNKSVSHIIVALLLQDK